VFEHILKIAITYAALDGEQRVDLRTLERAIDIGSWIETNTIQLFTEIGMDQLSKCERTILSVLKKARDGRLWRRDLQREMSGRRFNAEIFNRAIKALEINDQIACYDVTTGSGRSRTVVQYAK
jgi:hypothetical protein